MESTHRSVETTLVRVGARAWGIAMGSILGGGLMVATLALVFKGGEDIGRHLGLLSNVLPGYDVTLATSAQEALEALESRPQDLVISDVAMPGRSGMELLAEIRALGQDARAAVGALSLPEGFAWGQGARRTRIKGHQRDQWGFPASMGPPWDLIKFSEKDF